MAGRPSKLTLEIADAIEANLLKGVYLETAVVAAGVPKSTFMDWMKKGKADEAAGELNTTHAEFAWRIQQALAKVEIELLNKLENEKVQWTRYAWMLERRFRDRWSLKTALES